MKFKQTEIKKILGVSDALVSLLLSGKSPITYRMAKKISVMTGIEIIFIMEASPKELRKVFRILVRNVRAEPTTETPLTRG